MNIGPLLRAVFPPQSLNHHFPATDPPTDPFSAQFPAKSRTRHRICREAFVSPDVHKDGIEVQCERLLLPSSSEIRILIPSPPTVAREERINRCAIIFRFPI